MKKMAACTFCTECIQAKLQQHKDNFNKTNETLTTQRNNLLSYASPSTDVNLLLEPFSIAMHSGKKCTFAIIFVTVICA